MLKKTVIGSTKITYIKGVLGSKAMYSGPCGGVEDGIALIERHHKLSQEDKDKTLFYIKHNELEEWTLLIN